MLTDLDLRDFRHTLKRPLSDGNATLFTNVSAARVATDDAMRLAAGVRSTGCGGDLSLAVPVGHTARAGIDGLEFLAANVPCLRGRSARSARSPLGLVSNGTSQPRVEIGDVRRPPREKFAIHDDAKRVKRLRTTVGHAARLLHFDAHGERDAQRWNKKFITLTYRRAQDWAPNHITKFVHVVYNWCKRNGVKARYVWVAELQARGALHYHMVLWLPKGKFLPTPDKQGWWPHGQTNTVTAQSPISYIAKYASKTTADQAHQYPKGARMHGVGGLGAEPRRHVRYWMAPMWVRDVLSGRADIRKVSGGYMDKFTGEFLPSPWRVLLGPGGQKWAYRIDESETVQ